MIIVFVMTTELSTFFSSWFRGDSRTSNFPVRLSELILQLSRLSIV